MIFRESSGSMMQCEITIWKSVNFVAGVVDLFNNLCANLFFEFNTWTISIDSSISMMQCEIITWNNKRESFDVVAGAFVWMTESLCTYTCRQNNRFRNKKFKIYNHFSYGNKLWKYLKEILWLCDIINAHIISVRKSY